LLNRLQRFLTVEEWTDREDDVCLSYVLQTGPGSAVWSLWLSLAGPFALLTSTADGETVARADVVTELTSELPPEAGQILQLLDEAGAQLLSAAEIESTAAFRPASGTVPASVFVMLFGDTDVPWWHEW